MSLPIILLFILRQNSNSACTPPQNSLRETSEPKAEWETKLAKHKREGNERTRLALTNTEYDFQFRIVMR